MITSPTSSFRRSRVLRALSLTALLAACSTVFAQNDANAPGANGNGRQRRNQAAAGADANGGNNNNNGNNGGRRGGNFDPAQMQEQMLTRLREQFGVTDDAEWKVISDRIAAVSELRRANAGGPGGGFAAFRGGQGGGGGGGQGGGQGRGFGRGGSPESDALRQAVTDNLPEAEIKSRLERLREARKANEEKLTKAQEELRAVLSVRQEALAVMFGLLP